MPHPQDNGYYEFNCTVQEQGQMPIYEPCGYASNVAYYHTALEVCSRDNWTVSGDFGNKPMVLADQFLASTNTFPPSSVLAMVQNYAFLAQGSSFRHGSPTGLGSALDNKLNDLFAYVGYQMAVSELAPLDSAVIHHLSYTNRYKAY